jgi:RHS repeat-associated protein
LTDPLGRTTSWAHDIQGRVKCKEYADGSKVTYLYENTTSRLRQRIDEKLQVTQYNYNRDDTVSQICYTNATVATPPVAFVYDAHYSRLRSMTDGTGTTHYGYIPINAATSLGAGQLASVDGPLPDGTITFSYDELGRRVSTAINEVASSVTYDAAGRVITSTNALGLFTNTYDGSSFRVASQTCPNGQTAEFDYAGNLQDQHLQEITNKLGDTSISKFIYGRDVTTGQITSWSQQADTETTLIYDLAYDSGDQLTAATVSAQGNVVNNFSYSYDPAGNRLTEQVDATTRQFSYNALNEMTSIKGDASLEADYQWDAEHRLISVTSGNEKTEFTYDGLGRRVGIRFLVSGTEVSDRRYTWCDNEICEERTPAGIVSKRFFVQGMKIESGAVAGAYFYSRDHLGSIRQLTDSSGSVRASYAFDPFGRQERIAGDLEADFGFAGMFWTSEIELNLTLFRAYDPSIGRWLSRDPLRDAEVEEGPNLYLYAGNNSVNATDLLGLAECCKKEADDLDRPSLLHSFCVAWYHNDYSKCDVLEPVIRAALVAYIKCMKKCNPKCLR